MACLHYNYPSCRAQTVCTVASSRPTFCFRACDVPLHVLSGQGKSTRTTKIHCNNSRDALSYSSPFLLKISTLTKKIQEISKKNSIWASDINETLEMPVHQKELANKIHETIQQNDKWEDVINLEPQDLEPDLVVEVLRLQARAKDALRFFNWADRQEGYEHNTDAYSTILRILLRARMLDEMLSIFKKMKSERLEISKRKLDAVVDLFGMRGKLQETEETFNLMEELGHKPGPVAYMSLLGVLMKYKMFDRAEILFDKMAQNGVPFDWRYSLKFQLPFSRGTKEDFFDTLNQMEQKGPLPNIWTYTFLIHGFCKLGDLHSANKMFQEALAKGLKPNTITYNALIHGHCLNGRWDEVRDIYKAMQENGCSPDSITDIYMIQELVKKEQLSI